MEKLAETLRNHPFVVVALFLIAVVSFFMQILQDGAEIYRNYLSLEVRLPIWLLLLIALGAGIAFIVIRSFAGRLTAPSATIANKKFGVERIDIDGKHFVNCEFDGTELVFSGTSGFSLEKNTFHVVPRFKFEKHAAITLSQLKKIKGDPALRPAFDATFADPN